MKIINDTDYYKTQILVNNNNLRVRFEPVQISGKGWSVAMVVGSRKTGRTITRAEGFESIGNYTLAQAQMAAENTYRDIFKGLK